MQRQTRTVRPAVIVGLLLIVGAGLGLVPSIRHLALRGLTGAISPFTRLSSNVIETIGWSPGQRQDNARTEELQQQLARVTEGLADARRALEAQHTADRLTEFLTRATLPSISAAVISYSPDPGIQSLVINAGRDQGLQAGQAVITDDGWLIGKVQTVHQATASVLLLNDAQSLVLARILNTDSSQGVIRGERGLIVRMDLIPKNDVVERGQAIVTSGLEPGIPPDLIIGTVSTLEQRSGEVFQRALVNIPIRYGRVRTVAVIIR